MLQKCSFRHCYDIPFIPDIIFNGSKLMFLDEVIHLSYNLDDNQDIIRAIKDIKLTPFCVNFHH